MTSAGAVDRSDWVGFFDLLTKDQEGRLLVIEVLDPDVGDQHEAERLPFSYASYDPRDDVVVVGVGGSTARFPVVLRHMIQHPTVVDVAVPTPTQTTVRVVDADGTTNLLHFYPKPALPQSA